MALIGDALRQVFMPKHQYESLREEEKAWHKLQKPFILLLLVLISLAILVSTLISLKIVFPSDNLRRPFCRDRMIRSLPVNFTSPTSVSRGSGELDLQPEAYVLTDQETVDYYWTAVFVPSALVFAVSGVSLLAGIVVAYINPPVRHGYLKVIENYSCASRRGGVRCLSILNIMFAITFGLLALFCGSMLLTLGSRCSLPLFWYYEISTWGLVILHGGAAFFLRRKAITILNENSFSGRNAEFEMMEAHPVEVIPDVERRPTDAFKMWMGPFFLSSDEDESDECTKISNAASTKSTRQRA